MNALELANCIDEGILIDYGQVSDMLRQQHAEIEDADKYALELERLYEDARAENEALKDKLNLANKQIEIITGWKK